MDKENKIPEVVITPVALLRVNDEVEIDREYMLTMFSNDLDLLEKKIRKNNEEGVDTYVIDYEDLPF